MVEHGLEPGAWGGTLNLPFISSLEILFAQEIFSNDPESGETVTARMRAGAPFTREGGRYVSLVEVMTEVGYTLGPNGRFVSADGDRTVAHFP